MDATEGSPADGSTATPTSPATHRPAHRHEPSRPHPLRSTARCRVAPRRPRRPRCPRPRPLPAVPPASRPASHRCRPWPAGAALPADGSAIACARRRSILRPGMARTGSCRPAGRAHRGGRCRARSRRRPLGPPRPRLVPHRRRGGGRDARCRARRWPYHRIVDHRIVDAPNRSTTDRLGVDHRQGSTAEGSTARRSIAELSPVDLVTRVAWAVAALALIGVGTLRAAEWLFVLCVLSAIVAGAMALAGGRSLRALFLGAMASRSPPSGRCPGRPAAFRPPVEAREIRWYARQRPPWSDWPCSWSSGPSSPARTRRSPTSSTTSCPLSTPPRSCAGHSCSPSSASGPSARASSRSRRPPSTPARRRDGRCAGSSGRCRSGCSWRCSRASSPCSSRCSSAAATTCFVRPA